MYENKIDNTQIILEKMKAIPEALSAAILKVVPDATGVEMVLWQEKKLPMGQRLTQAQMEQWYIRVEDYLRYVEMEEEQEAEDRKGLPVDPAKMNAALKMAEGLPRDNNSRTPYLTASAACDKAESLEEAVVLLSKNRLARAAQKSAVERRRRVKRELEDLTAAQKKTVWELTTLIQLGFVTKNLRVTPSGLGACQLEGDMAALEIPSFGPTSEGEDLGFAVSKRTEAIE